QECGIDFKGAKQALEALGSVTFKLPHDVVSAGMDDASFLKITGVALNDDYFTWLLEQPSAARVMAGMQAVSSETRTVLLNTNIDRWMKKSSELFFLFSGSLSVRKGAVEVPGNNSGTTAWQSLIGVSPSMPAAFFDTLFDKDSGKA